MGLINKGSYGMFFACGIWCFADVSSVSPSLELRKPLPLTSLRKGVNN